QRILGALAERFGSLDQDVCPLRSRPGLLRGEPLDVAEWGYERDLELDLLATQRGRRGEGRHLGQRTCELLNGFYQCRARQRTLSGFVPQARGLLGQTGLAAVTREDLGLTVGNLRELALDGFGDAGM